MTATHTFTVEMFANPFLDCGECHRRAEGYVISPGHDDDGELWPCRHRADLVALCSSWSPVDGCRCARHGWSSDHRPPAAAEALEAARRAAPALNFDPREPHYLNAGAGTHYAEGWCNTDVWISDTTRPDVRVTEGEPYPFPDDTFDAVYLGHVLEHIPWPEVVPFLVDMNRIAKPGTPVLAVGPDVYRCIHRWRDGKEPWHMVASTMEHADVNYQPDREGEVWTAAHHHWNCHADRLVAIMRAAGLADVVDISDKVPNNFQLPGDGSRWWDDMDTRIRWPVVAKAPWQCAAIGRAS